MKTVASERLTSDQVAELQALAAVPDEDIDTSDIPEQRDWSGARRGLFFRSDKQQLTLHLDADLVAWFKTRAPEGKSYQTGIEIALRAYVAQYDGE